MTVQASNQSHAGPVPAFLLHRNLPVYAGYQAVAPGWPGDEYAWIHAARERVNNWIYFRECEYLEISHLPESVDFVMPLMILTLRVELFMITIVADPNAEMKAIIPGWRTMRCEFDRHAV